MLFYQVLDDVTLKIKQEKEKNKMSIWLLDDFNLVLKEKFKPYLNDRSVISDQIKPELEKLLEEMIGMFPDLKVRSRPIFHWIDPFTTSYAEDVKLQTMQKQLRLLFQKTLTMLNLKLNVEDISERSNVCTDDERKCILLFLKKLNPDLVKNNKLSVYDFFPGICGAKPYWSLEHIVSWSEIKRHNFDKVCKELSWMNDTGKWSENAPDAVKQAIISSNDKSFLHPSYIRYLHPKKSSDSSQQRLDNLEIYIKKTQWRVGNYILFKGGVNNDCQRLPHRVSDILNIIKQTKAKTNPLNADKAWEQIVKKAQEAIDQPKWGRKSGTTEFYKEVQNPEKNWEEAPNQNKMCKH